MRERVTDRYVSQGINLAFLAPPVVEAILAATRALTLTTKGLTLDMDIPFSWNEQRHLTHISNAVGF